MVKKTHPNSRDETVKSLCEQVKELPRIIAENTFGISFVGLKEMNTEIPPDQNDGKLVRLDELYELENGGLLNIEMQNGCLSAYVYQKIQEYIHKMANRLSKSGPGYMDQPIYMIILLNDYAHVAKRLIEEEINFKQGTTIIPSNHVHVRIVNIAYVNQMIETQGAEVLNEYLSILNIFSQGFPNELKYLETEVIKKMRKHLEQYYQPTTYGLFSPSEKEAMEAYYAKKQVDDLKRAQEEADQEKKNAESEKKKREEQEKSFIDKLMNELGYSFEQAVAFIGR